jgi:hypothetical protein
MHAAAARRRSTSTSQSPINIADVTVQYDATLAPLQISYGETESWTMEVTGA